MKKGRCVRERCDGLEVMGCEADGCAKRASALSLFVCLFVCLSVCACPKVNFLLVFYILSSYFFYFTIFQLSYQFSALFYVFAVFTKDILVTEQYAFWKGISTENAIFRLTDYLLTYLLTPYSTVFLEKLTGFQLVKKFPSFLEPEGS